MIAGLLTAARASPLVLAAIKWGMLALAVLAFLFLWRRGGEQAGRAAERLEALEYVAKTQQKMARAAKNSPADRAGLTARLRDRLRPF